MSARTAFDPRDLETKVKAMYRRVAEDPHGEFHFEMGRALAERLGYALADLNRIPAEAIESFAGVGYFFDFADLKQGETVIDLGSGSGMDTFVTALKVGSQGHVIGIDMTDAQLDKAERLRAAAGFSNVTYRKGYVDNVPCNDASADVVISNGVINLAPDKTAVFREAVRLLKPGGRLAIADIVTTARLPDAVIHNADLWAACVGGAVRQDDYRAAIESVGLVVSSARDNAAYRFLSPNATGAQEKWGVKSISLLAVKP
jgi:arsenite methyltransferase